MSAKVRWGLLSTARINDLVLAGGRQSDLVEFFAVASRDREHAEAYAQAHELERAHGSYEALLADPDVEAVHISLPNSLHVEWSIRALEAGKHVLCEKPLTRRREEAEQAFAAAERAGRFLMEAFMYRHHPQSARVKQLVDEGACASPATSSPSSIAPPRQARPSALCWVNERDPMRTFPRVLALVLTGGRRARRRTGSV